MVNPSDHPTKGYQFASSWAVGGPETDQRGSIDEIANGRINGWCVNFLAPTLPARLSLVVSGQTLAEFSAVAPRPDIAAATGISSNAGFSFSFNQVGPGSARSFLDDHEVDLRNRLDEPADIRILIKNTAFELERYSDGVFSISNLDLLAILRSVAATATTDLASLKRTLMADHAGRGALTETVDDEVDVRCIAFYLPQFHPIAENDEWWGKGFTEWTNVTSAVPLFDGHEQPRLPADLGFYDLRLAETQEHQAAIAREYGIHGFCYHYYWFSGRKILQSPIEQIVARGSPDFPFCVCWANESWSRRWDGSENEVLIQQEHDLEIDSGLINELIPLFKDPRYIRVNGRPLFIIYRVSLLPDSAALFGRWRDACVAAGLPPVHVCMAETFGLSDPAKWGCDSAVEFPPHKVVAGEMRRDLDDLRSDFSGNVYDYREVVQNDLISHQPDYVRYRTVMMGWDNTSRRGAAGTVFHYASPSQYETWLKGVVDHTRAVRKGSERLVFVNAWNEWGEGTYLEPDRRRGHAYLNATRRALSDSVEWPQLLDSARMRGSLEGAGLTEFLDTVQQKLTSLDRSVDFMRTRILSQELLWGQTLATDIKPPVLSNQPILEGGRIWIDRVGSQNTPRHHIQSRDGSLFITGWCLFNGSHIDATSLTYLAFHELDGAAVYFAPIYNRKAREDLVRSTGLPEAEALWSGFSETICVDRMKSGNYAIGIWYPGMSGIHRVLSRCIVTIS